MTNQEKTEKLLKMRNEAEIGGGQKAIDTQHGKGKYTARERIDLLLDKGSFEEIDMFVTHRCTDFDMEKKTYLGDGVVVGSGTIDGRLVFVYAQDFTVIAGTLSETMSQKICKVMDMAMKLGAPIIGINDSGGARIQEGACALAGFGEIFERNILASGVIPQISLIYGYCAGGAVYSPALTDFVLMTEENSCMYITGPKVVKTVIGENVTDQELGGAYVHATKSGVTHFTSKTEEEGLQTVRKLLSFIPQNNMEDVPQKETNDKINRADDILDSLMPDNPNKPYDMKDIIYTIVDDKEFFEVQKDFAKNIICGFTRFNGRATGLIANQPNEMAGVLDCNSSRKAARFIRFCDAFNIPILTLVDVPGFLCGTGQEYAGIIDHGAKLLFAYGEATVPKVTITIRKSYGGSHIVMSCKQIRGDINYAWPNAEIAVMGAAGAIGILQTKNLKNIENEEERAKFKAEKIAEYEDKFTSPYQAAARGYIDDVILPHETRFRIIRAFEMLQTKRQTNPMKKHSNIPL